MGRDPKYITSAAGFSVKKLLPDRRGQRVTDRREFFLHRVEHI